MSGATTWAAGGIYVHDSAELDAERLIAGVLPKPERKDVHNQVSFVGTLGLARQLSGDDGARAPSRTVLLLGALERRQAMDGLLQTAGATDELVIEKAYERFGSDAWLRLHGSFAFALFVPEEASLHLVRGAGVRAPPLYLLREGRRSSFSSHWRPLLSPASTPDEAGIAFWLEHGLWPNDGQTAHTGIELVAPGTSVTINQKGRNRRTRWYGFSPLVIPRGLDRDGARQELGALLASKLAPVGRSPAARLLASDPARTALLTAQPALLQAPLLAAEERGLEDMARQSAWPLPLSTLRSAACAAQITAERDLVWDLGARELFGGTSSAMRAHLAGLAVRFERNPKLGTLRKVVASGLPLALAARDRALADELYRAGRAVALRWSRHLPGSIQAGPDRNEPPYASHTGEAFVDRRFAEVREPGLGEVLRIVAERARASGHQLLAPFLEPELIELLFSLPAPLLIEGDRSMALLGSGLRLGPNEMDGAATMQDRIEGLGRWRATR